MPENDEIRALRRMSPTSPAIVVVERLAMDHLARRVVHGSAIARRQHDLARPHIINATAGVAGREKFFIGFQMDGSQHLVRRR